MEKKHSEFPELYTWTAAKITYSYKAVQKCKWFTRFSHGDRQGNGMGHNILSENYKETDLECQV
jgi:hypothetical protein